MTHRHKHGRPGSGPAASVPQAAEALATPSELRWRKRGRIAVGVWFLGGYLALVACALLQAGPFAWAAAWQSRHWGSDNFILSFLPGFAVLTLSFIPLRLLPKRPDRPFLYGVQEVLSERLGTRRVAPPSPDQLARTLLRFAKVGFVLSVLCPVAGGVACFLIIAIGNRGAGAPLPEVTLASMAQGALPDYARLTGAAAQPDASWVHDYALRQTRYHDVYLPLTNPGWHAGDKVTLLEEDRSVVDDDPPSPDLAKPGPIEGRLERGALPDWMVTEMRRTGVAVVDDPVVLVRSDLHGVVPGADMVMAVMSVVFGVTFGLFSLAISFAWRYRRRTLLRSMVSPL